MCTLSFVPTGGNDFVLTCNRDESLARATALPPQKQIVQHLEVLFPIDPKGKGTWIANSANGFSLCLLNGGFVKHKNNPPYRKSRGLVLLDFFQFNNVNQFVVNYNFNRIEPFTMVIVEYKSSLKLYELVWDGKQAHLSVKDQKLPQIWSSTALYPTHKKKERELWFETWKIENSENLNAETIKNFHITGGGDDSENKLVMRRSEVSTVSITQIIRTLASVEMSYQDMLKKTQSSATMDLA